MQSLYVARTQDLVALVMTHSVGIPNTACQTPVPGRSKLVPAEVPSLQLREDTRSLARETGGSLWVEALVVIGHVDLILVAGGHWQVGVGLGGRLCPLLEVWAMWWLHTHKHHPSAVMLWPASGRTDACCSRLSHHTRRHSLDTYSSVWSLISSSKDVGAWPCRAAPQSKQVYHDVAYWHSTVPVILVITLAT